MTTQTQPRTVSSLPPGAPDHVLGTYSGGTAGPTVIVAGGVHGNEPSGVQALQRVFERLNRQVPEFQGRLVGIAGNLQALAQGERFIEEDLNRIWLEDRVAAIRSTGWEPRTVEQREQARLLELLEHLFATAEGDIYFLDLHTSSAKGKPFVCIGDTLRNRHFAMQFPVPVILGLEEQIDGALLEWVNNRRHITVGVEAGRHDDTDSVDHHEAIVLLALVAAGCLSESDLPDADELRAMLRRAVGSLPPVLEVRHRHALVAGDGFEMQPGYANFQTVDQGDLLAHDSERRIRATHRGRILLPLYQGLGNDGFFLVRDVRPFWLKLSAILRRFNVGRFVHWLPGVHRDAHDSLVADHHVARWYVVEIFHLLGFRKRREIGDRLYFSRRTGSA